MKSCSVVWCAGYLCPIFFDRRDFLCSWYFSFDKSTVIAFELHLLHVTSSLYKQKITILSRYVFILRLPYWKSTHGTHMGCMWEPCGSHVESLWVLVGTMWEPCGTHVRNCCEIPLGIMWDSCGSRVGPTWPI